MPTNGCLSLPSDIRDILHNGDEKTEISRMNGYDVVKSKHKCRFLKKPVNIAKIEYFLFLNLNLTSWKYMLTICSTEMHLKLVGVDVTLGSLWNLSVFFPNLCLWNLLLKPDILAGEITTNVTN